MKLLRSDLGCDMFCGFGAYEDCWNVCNLHLVSFGLYLVYKHFPLLRG